MRAFGNLLDNTGIGLSVVCLIHCLAFPVLAIATPALKTFFENELLHILLLFILLPVAFFSFFRGMKLHGKKTPVVLGAIGILLLVLAILLEDIELGFNSESVLTVCGSIILVIAHYLNIQRHQGLEVSN